MSKKSGKKCQEDKQGAPGKTQMQRKQTKGGSRNRYSQRNPEALSKFNNKYVVKKAKAQLKPNLTRGVKEMASVNTLLAF